MQGVSRVTQVAHTGFRVRVRRFAQLSPGFARSACSSFVLNVQRLLKTATEKTQPVSPAGCHQSLSRETRHTSPSRALMCLMRAWYDGGRAGPARHARGIDHG
jgi:hypothetical protein